MSDQNRLDKAFEEYYNTVLREKELSRMALDHSGDLKEKTMYALAGDALLDLHLFEYLMNKPNQSATEMDSLRQKINTDPNFARIARLMGLKTYIHFPHSATETEKETADSYYNMTLEALAYVVFKEGGIESSRDFFRRFIEPDVDELISGQA